MMSLARDSRVNDASPVNHSGMPEIRDILDTYQLPT
jgi:hypothetical protein